MVLDEIRCLRKGPSVYRIGQCKSSASRFGGDPSSRPFRPPALCSNRRGLQLSYPPISVLTHWKQVDITDCASYRRVLGQDLSLSLRRYGMRENMEGCPGQSAAGGCYVGDIMGSGRRKVGNRADCGMYYRMYCSTQESGERDRMEGCSGQSTAEWYSIVNIMKSGRHEAGTAADWVCTCTTQESGGKRLL